MKKSLLTLALVASSMTMFAEDPVLFSEDFEWLAPWSTLGNGTPAGSTVETDNPNANAPQVATPIIDDVSAAAALEAKGYVLLGTHAASKAAREPEAQIYIQTNYLKFGLTGYYSGISMPIGQDVPDGSSLSFDWCSMRQGSGVWDPTQIVVIVNTDGVETQFDVETLNLPKNAEYEWKHVVIDIPAGTIKKGSFITFRNADSQWPVAEGAPALRWFLDNVKLTATAGVNDVFADNDATPVYYNLQGIQVQNPAAGNLYIVRQGNKVSKQLVK